MGKDYLINVKLVSSTILERFLLKFRYKVLSLTAVNLSYKLYSLNKFVFFRTYILIET